jgi:Ras GTPase-activating-like protein IQGAP2/3
MTVLEIQELKRNLVSEIRKNHVLERELNKLDKRIALLIKNRGNIQDVLAACKQYCNVTH